MKKFATFTLKAVLTVNGMFGFGSLPLYCVRRHLHRSQIFFLYIATTLYFSCPYLICKATGMKLLYHIFLTHQLFILIS